MGCWRHGDRRGGDELVEQGLSCGEEKRVADVLELIYRLCEDGKTRTAMDLLLESIDDAFHDGRFAFVNELLSKVCLDRLSLTLQLALLAFSRPCAEHLPRRVELADEVERMVRRSDPDRADRLLRSVR